MAPISRASRKGAATASSDRRVVVGTLLGLANVAGVQVLRLAGNVVTTRLLFPEAYGLMVPVMLVMQGLAMVSDVGIVPSIVQHERGEEPSFLRTAWTLQAGRGLLLAVLALALAWPTARFYGHPEIAPLLAVASAQGLIGGLSSTKLATLNRRMTVGRLLLVNIATQVVTLAVMIGWALAWPSVWALLVASVAGELARTVLSHLALPGPRDRWGWSPEAAAVIFHFGKWIFLSTLVTYLGMRFDALALGRLVPIAELGLYNIGQTLAQLPSLVTSQVVAWVLLPALSQSYRARPHRFRTDVERARRVINATGVLLVSGTAIAAPSFFRLVYDARYQSAAWMVQLSMLPAWFSFLQETSGRVPLAMGDSRPLMLANVARLAGTVPGALGGFWLGERVADAGIAGLIIGLTIGSFAGYVAIARSLHLVGVPILISDLKWTALCFALAALGGLPWLAAPYSGADARAVSLGVGPVVIVLYAAWVLRIAVREARGGERPRSGLIELAG